LGMIRFHSFSWLSKIPLCINQIFLIHSLVGANMAVSITWLLWIPQMQ
jgi:hypothetical protein